VAGHALVDDQDADLARFRWCMNNGGYAVRSERGRPVLMHRIIAGAPPELEVDHINRDRRDNRRCNLRLTDCAGNARNCGRNRTSQQPYKGVRRLGRRWGARLKFEGTWHCLGWFDTSDQAAVAYDLVALALYGEFAATNFKYREDRDSETLLQGVAAEAAETLRVS
jgi:hypothetical protein